MDKEEIGRVGKPTGLSQAEPQEGLGPSGFDPSREARALADELHEIAGFWMEEEYQRAVELIERALRRSAPTSESDPSRIRQIGVDLASIRDSDEGVVIVGFGAHGPSHDCPGGHVSVTVHKGGEQATSEAVGLLDALLLARAKVNAMIALREKKRARDSGSGSKSEDAPQSAAEAEGPQSGAAKTAHRPDTPSSSLNRALQGE